MDVSKRYHDKEIIGILYEKDKNILVLKLEDEELIFNQVIQIELNYFSDQNVVFDIEKYNCYNIPPDLNEDYPFLKSYFESERNCDYYYIHSSTGLTGIIVCEV